MKKYLFLIALLTVSQLNILRAQTLFTGPDTVCINQPVHLTSNVANAASYYWGFCSGSLSETPTFPPPIGTNLGHSFDFNIPGNIDIVKDDSLYYGFVVNTGSTEFLRLNFGTSLDNIPTVTNFGNLTLGLPKNPTSLFIVKDTFSSTWFIFVSGGFTPGANSQLARIDFGHHLNNPAPNIANFGNYTGLLNGPKGIFIAQNPNGNWWGYLVNHNTNELLRLDFSFNISNTPLIANLGTIGGYLNEPTDLAAIRDNDNWYMFVTNEGNNTVTRISLGYGLDTTVVGIVAGTTRITDGGLPSPTTDFNHRILVPSAITLTKDCGNIYAYITDSTTSQLIGIQMHLDVNPALSTYSAVDYNNVGFMNFPSGISSVIRYHDDIYGFITNTEDSTLTRFVFEQCHNATIPSFTEVNPPTYSYDSQGVYNVYFVVNEGLPSMEVQCKTITVIPPPPIYMNNDTTICKGDTIKIHVVSDQADSIRWATGYNIDTSNIYVDSVRVYPAITTTYPVTLYYGYGCSIDTAVRVIVNVVNADAGPDRYIIDGASTIIGGPYTTQNGLYVYDWSPYQFLSDTTVPNPTATPPYDFTYYLTVTQLNEGYTCKAKDTMVVHIDCADLVLPNAFAPSSNHPGTDHFGILNKQISKLNYLRIYDRWGALVFETTDPQQRWDGNYNGQPAPPDVYVWEADGFCLNGPQFKRTGNVTLLR